MWESSLVCTGAVAGVPWGRAHVAAPCFDQVKNQHADDAAELGKRAVPEAVTDARLRYFAAASHWYPLVEDIQGCKWRGKVGQSLELMVWSSEPALNIEIGPPW